jgi:hypothetical protein
LCGDQLLVIDVVMSQGRLLLQTVWATEPDRLGGRRRTDIETIFDQAYLLCRLGELVPAIAGHLPAATAAAA